MQRENKWKNEKEAKDLLSWSRKRNLAENPSWFQSEKLRHDKCHPEYHYPDSMTDKETMSITISLGFTLLIPTSQGLLCNYYTVSHLDNSSPQTLPSSLSRYAVMDLLHLPADVTHKHRYTCSSLHFQNWNAYQKYSPGFLWRVYSPLIITSKIRFELVSK